MAVLNNFRSAQGAEYLHGGRRGCLKGTRGAVLDGIELWAGDFDKSPVYWLNGLAGTGKSTIAQTTAKRMFANGQLGASFFCSRDFKDRSNLQFIFPTLAVQLARKYSEFRSNFVPLVQSNPGITHESLYNQMGKLIVQPLKESAISTVIIIDALDECEDEEPASAILSVLGQFVSEIPKVKFFLTGRPEPRIQEGFRLHLLAKATDVFILHEVKQSQVESDIRLFFTHSFSELASRRRGLDDWPTKEQLDLLCERAAGLFVYAVATVKFINRKNSDPREQLDHLLQSFKSSAFGNDDPGDDPRMSNQPPGDGSGRGQQPGTIQVSFMKNPKRKRLAKVPLSCPLPHPSSACALSRPVMLATRANDGVTVLVRPVSPRCVAPALTSLRQLAPCSNW
jgi:hypothetical protein